MDLVRKLIIVIILKGMVEIVEKRSIDFCGGNNLFLKGKLLWGFNLVDFTEMM